MSALDLSPDAAARLLVLIEHALAQAPPQPLGWLHGYAYAHARRGSAPPPSDPRRDPDEQHSSEPPPGPAHAAALARVSLSKRPPPR